MARGSSHALHALHPAIHPVRRVSQLQQRIVADYEFCLANPEEFTVGVGQQARVSHTSMMRTTAALNPEATASEFVEALASLGINANTARKQFNQSRAFDALQEAS